MRQAQYIWRILGLVALLPAVSAFGAAEYIVKDGIPHAAVVVPRTPSISEQFAAKELIDYLKKITGATLPQVGYPAPPGRFPVRIFLGRTGEAAQRGLTFPDDVNNDDAFMLTTRGNDLFILGKGDRGTLYGVYEFLERQGVRWLMPTEIGEVVPCHTSLALPTYHMLQQPAFQYRRFLLLATPRDMKQPNQAWQVRMRFNSGIKGKLAEKMGGEAGTGPLNHNYRRLIDTDLYDQHPEYFALVKGKRRDPRTKKQYWKMDLSNPAVVDIAVHNTIAYLRRHPHTEFFSLSPNDGGNWCEDDGCKRLQDPDTGQSGPVFSFAKQIIERVGPLFPEVRFPVFSYASYKYPPQDFVAPKALMIMVAVHGDFSRAISAPENAKSRRQFTLWSEHNVSFWVYSYISKMAFQQLPWPIFRNTIQTIQYYRDMGVLGFLGQVNGKNWGPNGLHYYMVAKALWNPDLDVEAVFEDYCDTGFGPAAGAIKAYYNTYWHAVSVKDIPIKRAADAGSWSIFESAIDIYTPDVLLTARSHLNRAFVLAKDRPDVVKRLNLLEVSQTYAEKFLPFAAAHRSWRRNRRDTQAEDATIAHAIDVLAYIDRIAPKEPWGLIYTSQTNPYAADRLPRRVLLKGPRR